MESRRRKRLRVLWTRCSCISRVCVYIGHIRRHRKNKNPNPLSARHSLIFEYTTPDIVHGGINSDVNWMESYLERT
jgi:hypothetical protein